MENKYGISNCIAVGIVCFCSDLISEEKRISLRFFRNRKISNLVDVQQFVFRYIVVVEFVKVLDVLELI
jgi:hypothetical protein